jgi:hypothetical protein
MKKFLLIFTAFGIGFTLTTKAQSNTIDLKSGSIQTTKNFEGNISFNPADEFNGYHYKLVQFDAVPNKNQLIAIKNIGVQLLDYIPNNTYLAALPINLNANELLSFNVRTVVNLPFQAKQSDEVFRKAYPSHTFDKGGNIQLVLLCYKNVDMALAKSKLQSENFNVVKSLDDEKMITVSTTASKIESLINLPFVNYIECLAPIGEPEDLRGRSLHRSNAINTEYGAGRKYDGSGVTIGIADDGVVGPHIDFKGRLIQLATNNPASGATHGDMTGGIAVGAGNINPSMAGMATGARLVTFDIGPYSQIVDAVNNYNIYNLVVTSTSYSQGCNTYTLDSKFIDDQLADNKQLIHAFSGGNNAAANCNYGGGPLTGWGNITGGYKLGKNVIAVANVDANDVRDNSSSRGPAPDGRIKPDIAANGLGQMSTAPNNAYLVGGGTSAASPGIGGICTQLYQAYRLLNNGNNPDATLVKTVLLNTADEIGNPGPDYSFGFGRVNALKAAKVLEQNLYLKDSISQGDSNSFNITVPNNAVKLKVLMHWRDEGGQPGASKALVNDINMRMKLPNGIIELPWILNPAPNATTLNAPATKGNDNLNNVEQITINNPVAGNYEVKTYGALIPFGSQSYYLTYEIIKDDITLTYPIGGEGFQPGGQELLRWDTEAGSGNFKLEYSTDNGATYSTVSTSIASSTRQFLWTVPSSLTASGQVYLKISRGTFADSNDAPIAIIGTPTGLSISKVCTDTTTLTWTAVSGAVGYEVSKLGLKYMDSITTVTGATAKIAALSTDTNWYSVRAITANGTKGQRAIAIQKLPGTLNCSQPIDVSTTSVNFPANNTTYYSCDSINQKNVILNIANVGINGISSAIIEYKIDANPPVSVTYSSTINSGANLNYNFPNIIGSLAVGNHTLSAFVTTIGDNVKLNDTIKINFKIAAAIVAPVVENFNATPFPSTNWSVVKSTPNSPGWVQSPTITQMDGTLGKSAMFNNFSYNNRTGPLDELITPLIELPIGGSRLVFERAYKIYPSYFDSLSVLLADNCGKTFNVQLFKKGYRSLATILDSTTTTFTPTAANEWKRDTIDLSTYSGKSVVIKFINKSDYGNRLFIDNVNILANTGLNRIELFKESEITIYPNPSKGVYNIVSSYPKTSKIAILDINGKIVKTGSMESNSRIDLSTFDSGIYYLRIQNSNNIVYKKLIKH